MLAGDLYLPEGYGEKKNPAVIVSGPFGAVKEQASGLYAQELAVSLFSMFQSPLSIYIFYQIKQTVRTVDLLLTFMNHPFWPLWRSERTGFRTLRPGAGGPWFCQYGF